MTINLCDSHCHLDFGDFSADIGSVLENARKAGVSRFIIPGTEYSRWQHIIEFCQHHAGCHYALGCHPYFLPTFKQEHLESLDTLSRDPRCIAIGETGIDSTKPEINRQITVLCEHIKIANGNKRPLILHHRQSHHHLFAAFKQVKPLYGGVIHAFSGSYQDAKKYLDLGFKLGIGGTITYPRAKKTIAVIKQLSLQDIVLETDSPAMPLVGQQGRRNEPKYLPIVAKQVAELMAVSLPDVAEVTNRNISELFNLEQPTS